MKNSNKYYIFLDIQTNRCVWDEKDNLEHFNKSVNPQYYTFNARTMVGSDATNGINLLIAHAKINLQAQPVLVLCFSKASNSSSKYFDAYKTNLRKNGLSPCEIQEYAYNKYGDDYNLGKAVSTKLYHEARGKEFGSIIDYFDRFHTKYALKKDNYVVITATEDNIRDYFTEKPYVNYENIITFDHTEDALDLSSADSFIDVDCMHKKIVRKFQSKNFGKDKFLEKCEILYGDEDTSKEQKTIVEQTLEEDPDIQQALAEALSDQSLEADADAYSEAIKEQTEKDAEQYQVERE